MKMEPMEGSETSAFKTQTPGKYPKENILQYLAEFLEWEMSDKSFGENLNKLTVFNNFFSFSGNFAVYENVEKIQQPDKPQAL